MKKTLAFLLALLLTFTMLPVSAFAAENPTFTVTSATGKAGDEVTVVVEIANTLANEVQDKFTHFIPMAASGLMGPVSFGYAEAE